jgi:hypothetical protein
MAVGDDATAAGYPLVPNTGTDDALIRYGAREINRTRDMVAQVLGAMPTRATLGLPGSITISPNSPSGGANGDIWLKYT